MTEYFENVRKIDIFQSKCSIPIDKLVSLPILVPEIQRNLDHNRVHDIIEFQKQFFHQNNTLCFIGDLTIAIIDDSFTIIDGFHRFSSMKHIYLLQPMYNIGLTLIYPSSHIKIEDVFLLMNKSEPVPYYIMQTTLDLNKRNLIENFTTLFTKKYRIYISKAKQPHRPNINLDVFLTKLVQSDMFRVCTNAKEMMNYISYINVNRWKDMDAKKTLLSIDKACKFSNDPLFISNDVDDEWINNTSWIEDFKKHTEYIVPTSYAPITRSPLKKRKTFPKNLRMLLWTKYFSDENMKGVCSCCQYQIDYNSFEVGHIISVFNGGTSTIENIVPLCSVCNKSCGSLNLTDFANKYNFPLHIII